MIFRSPFPEPSIPDLPLTDYVFEHVEKFAAKPALVEGLTGRAYTYAELYGMVRRAAAGLARRGFEKGDVLAVFCPNVPEFAVAFHAAAMLGGVTTPVNPAYTAEELEHQLSDAGARFLVTVPALLDKAGAAAAAAGVEEVFVVGGAAGATPFGSLLEADPEEVPRVEISPGEDLAALPYSSGTTGLSKGVMLTHRNCVANIAQVHATGHATERDTLVCVLPLFHIYGLQVILNHSLRAGATIIVLPRFDLEQLLGVIERHRVTMGHFVPPIVLALAKSPAVERFDLSSMKTVFSGAAPLGREVSRAVAERLGCLVKQGYGMTEAAPATHMMPDGAERNRPGSVGCCVPHMESKLVSVETGEMVVAAGEAGEVCVRGPQVMRGYHRRPEATAATVDEEGWLHTGDIGYFDEDGYLFIVDRAKELIKYKGFQVAPAELEALLLTHPSVADAAVIPSPDEEAGEVPKAFVVVREGHGLTEEEVLSFVARHVAPHKKVRLVEFAAQIPKSPSGKILRRLLVQRERERAGA